ncbi:MAG: malto-oligosyltrehalose trehalohydrolase, partial [Acidimicrobiia bacterium]|nr:malto-oligosyltrehalose trehalohydrolase [Acidimicrobiia bacterium]
MTRLEVWAPNAQQRVEAVVGEGERVPLELAGDGWWWAEVASLAPGQDYRFSLDGGDPMPDPRSPWQPAGVHGPSRVVDHAAFEWTDSAWSTFPLADALVYELHVGTFSPEGTFDGAVPYLDQLVDLGINTVEVMPVNQFPGGRGWGYDGVDLYAPQHEYGGPDGLKRLVDACHARGLAVILDVVYNHIGPSGSVLADFSEGYFAARESEWGRGFNLDGPASAPVRDFMRANVRQWIGDYHFDGLRFDAVQAIADRSPEHIVHELTRAARTAAGHRRLFVVAEDERQRVDLLRANDDDDGGLDAIWGDDFHHSAFVALTHRAEAYFSDYTGSASELASAAQWNLIYQGQWYDWQRQGRGTDARTFPGSAFVWFLENHDQVANTGFGDHLQ